MCDMTYRLNSHINQVFKDVFCLLSGAGVDEGSGLHCLTFGLGGGSS